MGLTVSTPAAGQANKVKTYPNPEPVICVRGNAIDGYGNQATYLVAYVYPDLASVPTDPDGGAMSATIQSNGDFEIRDVPDVGSNAAGTIDNVLALWVGFGSPPDINRSTVSFKGKSAGDEDECG